MARRAVVGAQERNLSTWPCSSSPTSSSCHIFEPEIAGHKVTKQQRMAQTAWKKGDKSSPPRHPLRCIQLRLGHLPLTAPETAARTRLEVIQSSLQAGICLLTSHELCFPTASSRGAEVGSVPTQVGHPSQQGRHGCRAERLWNPRLQSFRWAQKAFQPMSYA